MIEGFVTCSTPRWVVVRIFLLALSSGMFHIFASVGASTILSLEVRIVFPGCRLVMLASSFDNWLILVLAADTQTLDSSMVPNLESPVISVDGIVSEVIELIISVLSLSSFPAS